MENKITPEILAQNIKDYLSQGIKLEEIKNGALEKGISIKVWENAIKIIHPQKKYKRLLFKILITG